jgi:hypothetical protein
VDGDTPFHLGRSVYQLLVVTTKLSTIVSMKKKKKKKKKTGRVRCCYSWHRIYAGRTAATRKASKKKER